MTEPIPSKSQARQTEHDHLSAEDLLAALRAGRIPVNITVEQLIEAKDETNPCRPSALHLAAKAGLLNQIKGGVTAKQLASALDNDENSALHKAACHGHLNQIQGGVTVEALAVVSNHMGYSALDEALMNGHLDQIQGGVTAGQLAGIGVPGEKTALHVLADSGNFLQLKGDILVAELAGAKDDKGRSALHEAAWRGHLNRIPGGVSAKELAHVKDNNGCSALHDAAEQCHLNQVMGGVTARDLADSKNNEGVSALHTAAASGCLGQISGDVPVSLLIQVKDQAGRCALGYALELWDWKSMSDWECIPSFHPEDLPRDVLCSRTVKHGDYSLLDHLLLSRVLPKRFVQASWLDWAEGEETPTWDQEWMSPELDCFIQNVKPEFMATPTRQGIAMFVSKNAPTPGKTAVWFGEVMGYAQGKR
jgi:ankyrin repeat protein